METHMLPKESTHSSLLDAESTAEMGRLLLQDRFCNDVMGGHDEE